MSDIIDINVTPTIEEVTINTTQFLTTINVNTQSGGGAVDSVNGQTGIVVLDADDISDSGTTNKFVTSAEKTAITHTNRTILDAITEAFTTALKSTYDMAKSNIDALLLTGSRLITNSEITILSNTSGTNTGDNATNTTSNSYADAKVTDAIVDGVTTVAPSQNAVFDALALKVDKTSWIDISATSTIVGFSDFTTKQIWYKRIDTNLILVKANLAGTSNSGLLTFTIPFVSANNVTNNISSAYVVNNGIYTLPIAVATCNPNTSVVNVFRDGVGTPFSISGTKLAQTTILIEIQ